MAIASNLLGSVASTTAASSYATGSHTPSSNALVIAAVYNRRSGGSSTGTVSGNGLTWVSVLARTMDIGGTSGRLEVFRAMGASPSTGATTVDFSGTNQDGCTLSVIEFTGVDTSGTNGSGAVVQSASNQASSGTAASVTLAAFGDAANNAAFGAFALKGNATFTADTAEGYTERDNLTFNTPNSRYGGEWDTGEDLAVEATWGSSGEWGAIALEIKVAAGGAPPSYPGWYGSKGGWW